MLFFSMTKKWSAKKIEETARKKRKETKGGAKERGVLVVLPVIEGEVTSTHGKLYHSPERLYQRPPGAGTWQRWQAALSDASGSAARRGPRNWT